MSHQRGDRGTAVDPVAATGGDREELAGRLATVAGRLNRLSRPAGDGLAYSLLSVLANVVRNGPVRPSELARTEVVAPPTMTRLLAELARRGLVVTDRDPVDGRSFFVRATTAGEEALRRGRRERAECLTGLLSAFTPQELGCVHAALVLLEQKALTGLP